MQNAANYHSPDQLVKNLRPEIVMAKIKQSYMQTALAPRIMNSKFINVGDLFQSRSANYMRVPKIDNANEPCGAAIDGCNYANAETTQNRLLLTSESVKICHFDKGEIKLDTQHLELIAKGNKSLLMDLCKKQVSQTVGSLTDAYALYQPIARAASYNHGTNAGYRSGNINLGEATAGQALTYTTKGDARRIVLRLKTVLEEAGVEFGNQKVVLQCSAVFKALLMEDYTDARIMCCDADPSVKGGLTDTYGISIYSHGSTPCVMDNTGKRLEYVQMFVQEEAVAPLQFQYSEFQKIKHDTFYLYAYGHDAFLFEKDAAAYAVVDMTMV